MARITRVEIQEFRAEKGTDPQGRIRVKGVAIQIAGNDVMQDFIDGWRIYINPKSWPQGAFVVSGFTTASLEKNWNEILEEIKTTGDCLPED